MAARRDLNVKYLKKITECIFFGSLGQNQTSAFLSLACSLPPPPRARALSLSLQSQAAASPSLRIWPTVCRMASEEQGFKAFTRGAFFIYIIKPLPLYIL